MKTLAIIIIVSLVILIVNNILVTIIIFFNFIGLDIFHHALYNIIA